MLPRRSVLKNKNSLSGGVHSFSTGCQLGGSLRISLFYNRASLGNANPHAKYRFLPIPKDDVVAIEVMRGYVFDRLLFYLLRRFMKKCANLHLIRGITPVRLHKLLNTGPMAFRLLGLFEFIQKFEENNGDAAEGNDENSQSSQDKAPIFFSCHNDNLALRNVRKSIILLAFIALRVSVATQKIAVVANYVFSSFPAKMFVA
jgi:hypothetical protein